MIDPNKWAENIETEREGDAIHKEQEQAAFIARRQIFNEQAPLLWAKIRETFEAFCDAYNRKCQGRSKNRPMGRRKSRPVEV